MNADPPLRFNWIHIEVEFVVPLGQHSKTFTVFDIPTNMNYESRYPLKYRRYIQSGLDWPIN
jgi:hypothetical protein